MSERLHYCESAGKAKPCGDCRFAPWNQAGEPKGPTIRPVIRKDLKCPQWRAKR